MNFIMGALCVGALTAIAVSAARAGIVEAGPDQLSQTTSLGAIIAAAPNQPVHILFVHGIRTGDRGSSAAFRAGLCARLKLDCSQVRPVTQHLDIGPNPRVTYLGQPVWPSDDAWTQKGAFVDRYEFHPPGRPAPVILDEVNWWPLALPLRCQVLMAPEAELAGPDKTYLPLCALDDDVHFPVIGQVALQKLIATRPKGGGAAVFNGYVKRSLMDWGLSDAVIAIGPMKKYLRDAIDSAFEYADDAHPASGQPAQFVVVSESLGSFIVFDAYAAQKKHAQTVLDRTACLYMFANQIPLLELGRLKAQADHELSAAAAAGTAPEESIHAALKTWAISRPAGTSLTAPSSFKQIVAFSDPSDALTFRVPSIPGATVVNLYDRNGFDFFHLIADPVKAHIGHSTNAAVLNVMFAH